MSNICCRRVHAVLGPFGFHHLELQQDYPHPEWGSLLAAVDDVWSQSGQFHDPEPKRELLQSASWTASVRVQYCWYSCTSNLSAKLHDQGKLKALCARQDPALSCAGGICCCLHTCSGVMTLIDVYSILPADMFPVGFVAQTCKPSSVRLSGVLLCTYIYIFIYYIIYI